MIASVRGHIATVDSESGSIIVEVNGIGYRIYVPGSALSYHKGEDILIHTHMVVREDSLTLYGFRNEVERRSFETLLTVPGIGPRVALAILGTLSVENLHQAVANERVEILTRVPGIGKKTAQKILLDLKDKLKISLDAAPIAPVSDVDSDVVDTLLALGYSVVEAQSAVQALPPDAPQDVEERVRLALQSFM